MSDQHSETEDHEDNKATESTVLTRERGAAVIRRLADGVANGAVDLGDNEVTVTVPACLELEIEYEQDSEEAELEVELEWPMVNDEAVEAQHESGTQGHDSGETEMREDTDEMAEFERDRESGDEDEAVAEGDASRRIDDVIGTNDAASDARFELYRDRANEWRWRLVHDNGNIIADSGEGYDRKATARNGLESVMRHAPGATVVEIVD